MARKNLLAGLVDSELPAGNSDTETVLIAKEAAPAPFSGMGSRGAIGAVTRSIEQLRAQSIVDLQPELVEASFITDRLEIDPANHAELTASIREHGQQVPILVRPHPERPGRYQVAYGRRRLRAAAVLGVPVRAVVKQLSDQQLVVAQGQENSARTDLSFIEKALFAAKLEQGGFDRETIMASLSVDKTGLSRLISAASKIPQDLIEAIGSAPKAGRDRWIELANRLEASGKLAKARQAIEAADFGQRGSDDRFMAVFNAVDQSKPKGPRPRIWKAEDGTRVAQIKEDAQALILTVDKRSSGAFSSYLVEKLPELYAAFKQAGSQAE